MEYSNYMEAPNLGKVVTHIDNVLEARNLPCGATVGDTCGGRSFNDNVAAVLESRSHGGWHEVQTGDTSWTIIRLVN